MTDQTALMDAPAIEFTMVSESRALVVIDQGPNLAALAKSINHHINRALAADISGERHRVKAGQELIEARKHVAPGEWLAWCKANIYRSVRDIQRLMRIAGADDPDAALGRERAGNRVSKASSRANATVSRVAPEPAREPVVTITLDPGKYASTGGSRITCPPPAPKLLFDILSILNSWSLADVQDFEWVVTSYANRRQRDAEATAVREPCAA